MKQKTLHALDGISEEYIKPLEVSSKPLASERVVSFPQIKIYIRRETGIYHQFGGDLNEIKDRESIE
jgi:hypothetical protein